jgi:uncharacterized protein with HEPN domain
VKASRDYRNFLDDIVAACRSIIQFVEGMTLDAYLAGQKTRYAVMRGYETLGRRWRRSEIGFFSIDDTILFTIVHEELKPLLPRLEALASQHRGADAGSHPSRK